MIKIEKKRLLPLILTLIIIIADQITKALIVANIDLNSIGYSFFDGYFNIIHVRNLGVLFSMGSSISPLVRAIIFSFFPVILLTMLSLNILLTPSQWAKLMGFNKTEEANEEFTLIGRWALAAVIGGGFGNIIDRIFRPLGVVDFIDLDFFGIFGLERWPTFNVADMAVTCGVAVLLATMLNQHLKRVKH